MHLIVQLDQNILYWIQENLRNPFLTPIFIFITRLGDGAFIWLVTAFILIGVKKYRKTGVTVILSLIVSTILVNELLKNIFCRVRPFNAIPGLDALIPEPGSYSFPSGHTTTSFAAATVIMLCLPRRYGIIGYFLAACIGFSRMYLGVHYPSDVLAGTILGILIGVGVFQLMKLLKRE
ncbi:MAG TPA: phosphatase PAP2 family protein [Clostridiales bacterium]|nr:phosphatase PAP2 family protein [Clostridiales bacterium]